MDDKKKDDARPKLPGMGGIYWIYLALFGGFLILFFFNNTSVPEITWNRFELEMLAENSVAKVEVVNEKRVNVFLREEALSRPEFENMPEGAGPHCFFNIGSVEVFRSDMDEAQERLNLDGQVSITYREEENWWSGLLGWLFPILIIVLFWLYILRGAGGMRGGGNPMMNFGQSKAREMDMSKGTKVTFKDVAGIEEAKEEIYELVKFLKDPQRYSRLGAKMPKGVLLVGPPGTGKTLLAKAVAGEAGVPFFSLTGSEFVEMFVGVGAARMRDLFEKAKAKAPSIIFIDEIDTIGRARGKASALNSNDEREGTLNQLLAELDGFDTDTGIVVLAATNRGDILDPALLRAGRFNRHIYLELPNLHEREGIFEVHLRPLKLDEKVDAASLAAQTPGFSGADIANICNEAALIAVRREKDAVDRQDFMDAIDRVVAGLEKKSKVISAAEKRRIAFHEAGHVTVSWYLPHSHPVMKVSIIPRGKSLGAAWFLPEERNIQTRSEFIASICTALGGRAAESLYFEEVSSNALDDLERATKMAYAMVTLYGLSSAFPNISFHDSGGEQSFHKPYSEKTSEALDAEVRRILDEAYEQTLEILKAHADEHKALAERLIEKEIVQREELKEIFGYTKSRSS